MSDKDKDKDNDNVIIQESKNSTFPIALNKKIKSDIDLLSHWKDLSKIYSLLHFKSSNYYKNTRLCMMIPIIFITICSGFLSIVFNTASIVVLLSGVLQLTVGLFTGIYNFLKIPELEESHYSHHTQFLRLENNIKLQLLIGNTEEKEYVSLIVYIKIVRGEINKLINEAPAIPERIIRKYDNSNMINTELLKKKSPKFSTNSVLPTFLIKNKTNLRKITVNDNFTHINEHQLHDVDVDDEDNNIYKQNKLKFIDDFTEEDIKNIRLLEKDKKKMYNMMGSMLLNL